MYTKSEIAPTFRGDGDGDKLNRPDGQALESQNALAMAHTQSNVGRTGWCFVTKVTEPG
jgi:hypothetical protein